MLMVKWSMARGKRGWEALEVGVTAAKGAERLGVLVVGDAAARGVFEAVRGMRKVSATSVHKGESMVENKWISYTVE